MKHVFDAIDKAVLHINSKKEWYYRCDLIYKAAKMLLPVFEQGVREISYIPKVNPDVKFIIGTDEFHQRDVEVKIIGHGASIKLTRHYTQDWRVDLGSFDISPEVLIEQIFKTDHKICNQKFIIGELYKTLDLGEHCSAYFTQENFISYFDNSYSMSMESLYKFALDKGYTIITRSCDLKNPKYVSNLRVELDRILKRKEDAREEERIAELKTLYKM